MEVLRLHLATAVPDETEQRLRTLAYQSLLGGLGTSVAELRRARVAGQPQRTALAARLGIPLDATRPDRLDDLTVDPDQITDDQLETLFGFASLHHTDRFAPEPGVSSLQAWRQAALTRQWRLDDSTDRDGATGPLPVIDPDHVGAQNLASTQTADPAHQLWSARRDFIGSLVDGMVGRSDRGCSSDHAAGVNPRLVAADAGTHPQAGQQPRRSRARRRTRRH